MSATRRLRFALLVLWLAGASWVAVAQTRAASSPADRLAGLINGFRVAQGLPEVPVSPLLTAVAQAHVQDLDRHPPVGQCNGHSWSAAGTWSACCYTADHAQAQCMWDKPREITHGAYPGPGFEIVFWAGGEATPDMAFERWQGSVGHLDVLLNRGVWSRSNWQAMGVAVSAHHAAVWFGESPDAVVGR